MPSVSGDPSSMLNKLALPDAQSPLRQRQRSAAAQAAAAVVLYSQSDPR